MAIDTTRMSSAFLAHLRRDFSTTSSDIVPAGLGETLARHFDEGHATWPELLVPPPDFARHIAEHIPPDAALEQALSGLHAADLYLACACARGSASALALFERRYVQTIAGSLRRIDTSPVFLDEVKQRLRERLFVAKDGAPPRIARYSGRGPLGAWVAVAAQRIALDLVNQDDSQSNSDGNIADAVLTRTDPELDYLRDRYRKEFLEAFQAAIAKLSERERLLLHLHYVNGLPHEQIAASYQVNQSTVSRWLAKARGLLQIETQRHLQQSLGLSSEEYHSLAALVASQLHLSLGRWLGDVEGVLGGTGTLG
jgi:RNA polymerase sigma-70 factor, ECF subfamily